MPDITLEIVDTTPIVLDQTNATPIVLQFNETGAFATSRIGSVQLSPSSSGAPTLSSGTEKAVVRIPAELNGMVLTDVGGGVSTVSSSGPVTVQIRRVRAGVAVNMLSTVITIDQGEYDSTTAAAPVINAANDDVQTGDQLQFDVTAAGTGVRGLVISFTFRPA